MSDEETPAFAYDPSSNPRGLRAVNPDEQRAALDAQELEIRQEIDLCNSVLNLQESPGFQEQQTWLAEEVQRAWMALANPQLDHDSSQFVRGQIHAFRTLMNQPNLFEARKKLAIQRLNEVHEAMNEMAGGS